MKTKIITQIREYYEDCTVSNLYCPWQDERFCYVLEDVGRPINVKVYGKTCIPEGVYEIDIYNSPKYEREMLRVSNCDDKSVTKDGIRFTGILVHGGNTVEDSEGCLLTAYHFDGDDTVWKKSSGDLIKKIREYIDDGYKVYWVITS